MNLIDKGIHLFAKGELNLRKVESFSKNCVIVWQKVEFEVRILHARLMRVTIAGDSKDQYQ